MKKYFGAIKEKRNSLMTKILLMCMAIVLIGLMLASLILFVWFHGKMQKEYRQLTETASRNIDLIFDYYMENSKGLATQWFQSAEGSVSRLDADTEMVKNMDLMRNVQNTFFNTPYLQSMYIVNKDRKISFSAGSGISFTADMDEALVEKLTEYENAAGSFFWHAPGRFSEEEEVPLLTICYGDMAIPKSGFTGAVLLNIDTEFLSKNLFAGTKEENLQFFIMDEYGNVIAHSDEKYCGENWQDRELVHRILEGEQAVFDVEQDGTKWEVNWMKSAQNGFYVVSQTEYYSEVEKAMGIAGVLAVIMLLAGMIMIAAIWPMGKLLFRPFHRMISDIKEKAAVEDSAEDEVQFLHRYYEKMSNDIFALNRKREKDFVVKNLLIHNKSTEIQKLLLKNEVISEEKGYFGILICISEREDESRGLQEYDMLKEGISDIFMDCLEELGDCTYFDVSLRRLLFIVSEREKGALQQEDFGKALSEAYRSVEELFQCRTFIVLSEKAESGEVSCASLFQKLDDAMATRLLLGESGFDGNVEQGTDEEAIKDCLATIPEALKAKDKTAYLNALEKLLRECAACSFDRFREILADLSEEIVRIRKKAVSEDVGRELQRESLMEQIANISSKEALVTWFELLYDETVLQIQKVNNHSIASQMADIVDYIDKHYDDSSLNVNMLADSLHISTPYFGKLFREFTGSSTLEYITKVRMEKAREMLLTQPNKDIGRIAIEVGYSNNAYFATAFKKYFGVSPSKMRDYHATEKESL